MSARDRVAIVERAMESLIGQKVDSVEVVPGALVLQLTHRGCDDDAVTLRVYIEDIRFDDESRSGVDAEKKKQP